MTRSPFRFGPGPGPGPDPVPGCRLKLKNCSCHLLDFFNYCNTSAAASFNTSLHLCSAPLRRHLPRKLPESRRQTIRKGESSCLQGGF